MKELKQAIKKHGTQLMDTILGYDDWVLEIDAKGHIWVEGERETLVELFQDFKFADGAVCGKRIREDEKHARLLSSSAVFIGV